MKNTIYKTVLELLPERAKVRLKQQTKMNGSSFAYFEVICNPEMSAIVYETFKTKLKEELKGEISEIYTEEEGHHFYLYFKPGTTLFT